MKLRHFVSLCDAQANEPAIGGFPGVEEARRAMDSGASEGQNVLEIFTPTLARKVAAMLDLDLSDYGLGVAVPRGWHFALLPATTRRSQLRPDGFAGLGVELPDLGLPRLMLVGRQVAYLADLTVGAVVERHSQVESVEEKGGERPRAIVRISHLLRDVTSRRLLLSETQTFMLLPASGPYQASDPSPQIVTGQATSTLVPDTTLLFQFSALGFNAHKIHLDRDYARSVEGFPDLVVNGGLTALLLTEFSRQKLGVTLASIEIKYLAPLFCDRPLTMAAVLFAGEGADATWQIKIHDDLGTLAASATVVAA